jgi:hypothetical protein
MTWRELINELKRIPEERLEDEVEAFIPDLPIITFNSLTCNSKAWYGFEDEDGDFVLCAKETMIDDHDYDEDVLEDYLIIKPGGFTLEQ